MPGITDARFIAAPLELTVREPAIVTWNRLEGRPRKNDFSQSIRAEIRDPLWMLARQWQLGEFQHEAQLHVGRNYQFYRSRRGPSKDTRFLDGSCRFHLCNSTLAQLIFPSQILLASNHVQR